MAVVMTNFIDRVILPLFNKHQGDIDQVMAKAQVDMYIHCKG